MFMNDVLDAISRPVVALDPENRVKYANPAACKAVGREGPAKGIHCREFFSFCPLDKNEEECFCSARAREGWPVLGRYDLREDNGEGRVFEVECALLGDGGGTVLSFADITDALKVEKMLERSAEGLTVLYELGNAFLSAKKMDQAMEPALELLLVHYDADLVAVAVPDMGMKEMEYISVVGCVKGFEPGAKAGINREDIAGIAILERCPAIVTDYSEGNFTRSELFARCGVQSGICIPMTVDNSVVGALCIMYFKPRQFDTAELWYMNVVANILGVYIEKERSLEKLEESRAYITSVLEGIGDGVIVVDRDLKVKFANRVFSDEHDRFQEEVIGGLCYEFIHGKDKPCFEDGEKCPVRDVLERGEPSTAEHTHYDKDGEPIYVQVNAYPIFDPFGKVVAAVETTFDITERVSLEHDLEKRVKELEEFYDMAVGRELRMVELKEDILKLEEELGKLRNKAK